MYKYLCCVSWQGADGYSKEVTRKYLIECMGKGAVIDLEKLADKDGIVTMVTDESTAVTVALIG